MYLPILCSHIPNTAIVCDAPTLPHNDVGIYLVRMPQGAQPLRTGQVRHLLHTTRVASGFSIPFASFAVFFFVISAVGDDLRLYAREPLARFSRFVVVLQQLSAFSVFRGGFGAKWKMVWST